MGRYSQTTGKKRRGADKNVCPCPLSKAPSFGDNHFFEPGLSEIERVIRGGDGERGGGGSSEGKNERRKRTGGRLGVVVCPRVRFKNEGGEGEERKSRRGACGGGGRDFSREQNAPTDPLLPCARQWRFQKTCNIYLKIKKHWLGEIFPNNREKTAGSRQKCLPLPTFKSPLPKKLNRERTTK